MKESARLRYSELPKEVDLETAVRLNREVWRKRDNFLSISSPVEIPESHTLSIFARVNERYKEYLNPTHRKQFPLVGYSVLPEVRVSWGYGYYLPDVGMRNPINLLEEFATDWLTKVIVGLDPYATNSYLKKVNAETESGSQSMQKPILDLVLNAIKHRTISRIELTSVFARALLSGDSKPLDEVIRYLSHDSINLFDEIAKLDRKEDYIESVKVIELSNLQMYIAKPIVFSMYSLYQGVKGLGLTAGSVAFPGVINICGWGPTELTNVLTHEYLHTLSFHEKFWGLTPINGYKMAKGIVSKEK